MTTTRPIDILAIGGIDLDLVLTVPYVPGPDEKAVGELVGRLPGGPAAHLADVVGEPFFRNFADAYDVDDKLNAQTIRNSQVVSRGDL